LLRLAIEQDPFWYYHQEGVSFQKDGSAPAAALTSTNRMIFIFSVDALLNVW
jgi:hypothetical protein